VRVILKSALPSTFFDIVIPNVAIQHGDQGRLEGEPDRHALGLQERLPRDREPDPGQSP
jgi:hypothetical protein